MRDLVLVGGGGHCKSCIDVVQQTQQFHIVGILDKPERVGQNVLGYSIIGTDEMIGALTLRRYEFLITVGQVRTHLIRQNIFKKLTACNALLATVISPRAYVSKHASVGEGTIVMHDALINAGAKIGKNCIVNTKALIEHDVIVEIHSHISTAAVLNGTTTVRHGTFFGSSAVSVENSSTAPAEFVKAGSLFKERNE